MVVQRKLKFSRSQAAGSWGWSRVEEGDQVQSSLRLGACDEMEGHTIRARMAESCGCSSSEHCQLRRPLPSFPFGRLFRLPEYLGAYVDYLATPGIHSLIFIF